ncbi:MAG TPA: T9SS type A sorting domain-containing protein [Chitinophagales bacterium]|nr:T9SS type A sorting domain-containing protein [Chitinophagales bacterium]
MANSFAQQRYIDEVFTQVQDTTNIVYGQNISVLTGAPELIDLTMDVYEPAGDTASARPLIVYMHPGDFLPILFNGGTNGSRNDSAVVEMCRQFAKRGYVVANIDYRLGWNPIANDPDSGQAMRTGGLLQAVYRGLQDAKTCVRFFRMNAATQGNTYKIDVNKIVVGGQGSAGYIATSYATLNKPSELQTLLKFISPSTVVNYGFVAGYPYINQAYMGDFDGLNGIPQFNNPNWAGYSSDINMVFNLEGDLGDSSWMEAGEVPLVSFHDVNNPLSPYTNGPVFVPLPNGTILYVVWVTGSHDFIRISNQLGNQTFAACPYTDPYSIRANQVNEGWEGLFPFVQPDPNDTLPGDPFHGQTGPWEWWDCAALHALGAAYGFTSGYVDTACYNSMLTNPLMSKTKALAYIDTVQGYLCPRIACSLFTVGIDEVNQLKEDVSMFPNPSAQLVHLQLQDPAAKIFSLSIYDVEGRKVFSEENMNQNHAEISCDQFGKGLFTIQIQTEKGIAVGKLVIE